MKEVKIISFQEKILNRSNNYIHSNFHKILHVKPVYMSIQTEETCNHSIVQYFNESIK